MTPAKQARTLWSIADDMATYQETLAMAEAQLEASTDPSDRKALEDGRQQIEAQLTRIGAELVKKADNVAGVLRRMKSEAELLAAEEMRLCQRRLVVERSEKWLKNYVMDVMRATGSTSIRTTTTTLRIQGNGGVQPLVVDEPKLPMEFRDVTVRMPAGVLAEIVDAAAPSVVQQIKQIAIEPSQARIRQALMNGDVPGAQLADRGSHLRIT